MFEHVHVPLSPDISPDVFRQILLFRQVRVFSQACVSQTLFQGVRVLSQICISQALYVPACPCVQHNSCVRTVIPTLVVHGLLKYVLVILQSLVLTSMEA